MDSTRTTDQGSPEPGKLESELPLTSFYGNGFRLEPDSSDLQHNLDRAREHLLAFVTARVPDADVKLIGEAIDFTVLAHKNQFRRSGMPYAEHPFEVAKLLAEFTMDSVTIVAGLLHDVVEDTAFTIQDVRNQFGTEVAFLVEAVTKISAFQAKSRVEQQAETFRKMLISVAKDLRVIMIKFADRLHNMRTLQYLQEERKKAIAKETIEVYAPLAHRFGLARIKWELEDLSFKYINSDAYKGLVAKVVEKRKEREEYTRSIIRPVEEVLVRGGLEAKVYGRPKHLYSIWRKMQNRKCAFEELYDLYGLRVIVKTVADCYGTLGLVHSLWTPLQSRFKDYIATPKSNLYQSLHTTLIGPGGKPIEIQIRTEEMDLTAEQGIAAHWAYKEGMPSRRVGDTSKWLSQFLDWQKDLTDSQEFMDFFRGDLAPSEIFVFTPQGDLVQLPKGATALDFAFSLHSEIGLHCIGAKVDGNLVPIHTQLRTGSRVEILKSATQHPSRDWLSYVSTSKAKSAVRRWLREEEKVHSIGLGKQLLDREFRLARMPQEMQKNLEPFAEKFKVESWDALWEQIGRGEITIGALSSLVYGLSPSQKKKGMLERVRFRKASLPEDSVLVSGLNNTLIRFATCCSPLPGDRIIGYVTRGRGVSIHRADCPQGVLLMKEEERIVPVEWRREGDQVFDVMLEIQGRDRPDLLTDLTKELSRSKVNVERASIITVRGQIRNRFKVQVNDLHQLQLAINALRKVKGVTNVARLNSVPES